MLRTGQLRRAPPRPRDLARRRGPRYRGPWRLPGPDSHRLAAVSLALGYTSLLLSSLRRPSYWTHIPTESRTAWVAGSEAGMPQSWRRSLTHSSQADPQPLTGRTMRACSRGATTERSWPVLATGRLN